MVHNFEYYRNTDLQHHITQMSRAKELQEKLDLQAKLRNSFLLTENKALAWLGSETKNNGDTEAKITDIDGSKAEFFTLPVVQTGSGLNFSAGSNDLHSKDDIHTVGEFIKSDKKLSSLSKKKRRMQQPQQTGSIYGVSKDDSKAMIALKRKMRERQREAIRKDTVTDKATNVTNNKKDEDTKIAWRSDNEDDDDEPRIQKSTKKTFGLLFNKTKKGI